MKNAENKIYDISRFKNATARKNPLINIIAVYKNTEYLCTEFRLISSVSLDISLGEKELSKGVVDCR